MYPIRYLVSLSTRCNVTSSTSVEEIKDATPDSRCVEELSNNISLIILVNINDDSLGAP